MRIKSKVLNTYANVDYLTMIYDVDRGKDGLFSRIADYQANQVKKGNIVRHFRISRYTGTQVGDVGEGSYGVRNILCVWGDECENWVDLLGETDVRPTRVDLAVTVLIDKPKPFLVRNTLRKHEKGLVKPKYQCNLRTILNLGGGDTLYNGKRSKPLLLRLYDKGVQSGDGVIPVGKLWRYEVEFKQDYALRARASLLENNFSHTYIRDLVSRIFDERGFPILFDCEGANSKLRSVVKISDSARKLEWMRKTVTPVVKQLTLMGLENEVVKALQLQDYYKRGL